MRWVLRYVPEYEERWNRFARPVNSSWRMDETAIRVRGKSAYLYQPSTSTASQCTKTHS